MEVTRFVTCRGGIKAQRFLDCRRDVIRIAGEPLALFGIQPLGDAASLLSRQDVVSVAAVNTISASPRAASPMASSFTVALAMMLSSPSRGLCRHSRRVQAEVVAQLLTGLGSILWRRYLTDDPTLEAVLDLDQPLQVVSW